MCKCLCVHLYAYTYACVLQSIAESIKKTSKPTHGSHSRTPSNASSTSAEVAQLTSHPDATVISSEMLGATEGSGAAGSEDSQLIDVPLDRSRLACLLQICQWICLLMSFLNCAFLCVFMYMFFVFIPHAYLYVRAQRFTRDGR